MGIARGPGAVQSAPVSGSVGVKIGRAEKSHPGLDGTEGSLQGPFEGFPSSKPVLLLKSDLPARGSQETLDTALSAGMSIQWAH